MSSTSKLWRGLAIVFILSFGALGWLGREIYLAAPPIPKEVRNAGGELLFTGVWGHGSYVAPDWSADWLHREATALEDIAATRDFGLTYAEIGDAQRAVVDLRVKTAMRANTYDSSSSVISLLAV